MDQAISNTEELKRGLIAIIRERSYREGDFTLASGKKSPFYIDVKTTSLHPEGARLIGLLAVDAAVRSGVEARGVGGLTLGADPIGTAVSLAAWQRGIYWPAYIVRKEPKGHGTLKYIEGIENLEKGAKLIVVEDVVTTGGSGLQAVERLRDAGFNPVALLAVMDREEGGAERFREAGLKFISLLRISDLRGGQSSEG